jgi:hypothetical protein
VELVAGTCELTVEISPRGRPTRVEVVSCPEGFAGPAVKAVRQWRWRPAELDGVPTSDRTTVQIRLAP